MQPHDQAWTEYFATRGFQKATPLGAGMEGAVYALTDTLVGKVWAAKTLEDVRRLAAFYSDLDRANPPILTPRIESCDVVDGQAVTIERRLTGTPIESFQRGGIAVETAATALIRVLRALKTVAATDNLKALSVIGEKPSLWHGAESWSEALSHLVVRRVALFGDQLRRQVPHFDNVFERSINWLKTRRPTALTAIHGDLCASNVMLDDQGVAVAVLDFGFMSTVGDPVFDAAISAGIYDMYGPNADAHRTYLTSAFATALGYSESDLRNYLTAYAMATSNVYDQNGDDGHFRWCAARLLDASVTL